MKKTVILLAALSSSYFLGAQDVYVLPDGRGLSRQFFEVPMTVLAFVLVGAFILTVITRLLDFRLRSKLISKDAPEGIIKQLIQTEVKDSKTVAMKWFIILAGIGLGLALISMTLPIGIHSLAILAFSISLSFLAYFFFIKRSENKDGQNQ
ncbi:MAG TPA: hypothetical protein VKR32_15680 [Puia sp.]|nr:hypothetical protein [Puia sp.]